ncbi:acyltransferase [Micromonospora sp. R77]|uniref:acyltransferase family protein n=1 Tax=Micromonospora sp. R77 TaxID=2925836 RepID=UPI001F60607D|nr:acyltransferase [Micromonospora sp. R77]MCI4061985.1 acyltransferase [Micromonospora sp. R77]
MAVIVEPSAPPRTERRRNCFDALRLLAALCVLVQHATAHLDTGFLWLGHGHGLWFYDGVMAFFILSGGMVYASAERCRRDGRPYREYLRNRFLRIVPALYAYLAVMVVALLALRVVPLGAAHSTPFLAWATSNLALFPVYHPALFHGFGSGVVNGSLWTIPVEVSFYLLLPGLVWLAHRVGFRAMVTVAFTVGVAGTVLLAALGGETTERLDAKLLAVTCWPWLAVFVVGIAAARVWSRLPQHWTLAVAAVLLYQAANLGRQQVGPAWAPVVAVAAALPLAYLLFWVGHHGPAVLRRTTERIGDLSFGVYIWHMPVVNLLLWSGIAGQLHGTALVTLAIALTGMIAYASWHLVEKPALRHKRYSSRPGALPAADLAAPVGAGGGLLTDGGHDSAAGRALRKVRR